MVSDLFEQRRRQAFVTERYFIGHLKILQENRDFWRWSQQAQGDSASQSRALGLRSHAQCCYAHLVLRYTGGDPIESLRAELGDVVQAYELYQQARAVHEEDPDAPPLLLYELSDYDRCLQLISLCYLLHRRDLLPRLVALQDPVYLGCDALYEDLLRYQFSERPDTDELIHFETYDLLVGALWAQDDLEAADLLQNYMQQWYGNFIHVPWHDGHLRIDGIDGDYCGYWSFEAGAAALLCNIDDSALTDIAYPRDLVAWARTYSHL